MSDYSTLLNNLFDSLIGGLGSLLELLIILVIGLLVAGAIKNIVQGVLAKFKADRLLDYEPVKSFVKNAKLNISVPKILGKISYWIIVLVTLSAMAEAANIQILSDLVTSIIEYIPNLLVATAMLLVVLISSNLVANLVKTIANGTNFGKYSVILSRVARVAILVFGIIITIEQLQIDISIISNNVTIIIAAISWGIALAAGLAFGLGGKEKAKQYLDKWV